jgi:hypothetical protein
VLQISNADAANIRRLLLAAETHCRERAVEQSYRRDAMKFLGERLLREYHHNRHQDALGIADALAEVAVAMTPPDTTEWHLGQHVPALGYRAPVDWESATGLPPAIEAGS